MSTRHTGTDRNITGSTETRGNAQATAIALAIDRLLPQAAAEARRVSAPRSRVRRTGPTAPICQSCGWQHTTQVADGACVDPAACAKRQEEWT